VSAVVNRFRTEGVVQVLHVQDDLARHIQALEGRENSAALIEIGGSDDGDRADPYGVPIPSIALTPHPRDHPQGKNRSRAAPGSLSVPTTMMPMMMIADRHWEC